MVDILERIKYLQKMRGWSNYELAHKSGLTEGSLNNLFRLGSQPRLSTLEALCCGFGITMSQLFAGSGEQITLTSSQSEILNLWNTLNDPQKKALLKLFKTL
jgi:transcriptional regulator with XRE-family HTH domain